MSSGAARRLTDRQQAVLERIDRRVPIKVIAQELGVSETRINQHIRALKDIFEAGSLGELVENYRATLAPDEDEALENPGPDASGDFPYTDSLKHYSQAAYTKTQINGPGDPADRWRRDDPGTLVMSDAMPLIDQAPWLRPGEPRVVPGVLDGDNAVLLRLGAIVGIAAGVLATVVLTFTAARTLSEAAEGKATVSVQQAAAPG
ncbi:MAG: hypothetical protein GC147_03690 [Porphyrobacter sp.]|nr:hypothetical protein [Porphyrobacter sp.]